MSEIVLNNIVKSILSNREARVGVVPGCKLVKRSITFHEAKPEQIEEPLGFVQVTALWPCHVFELDFKLQMAAWTFYQ